MKYEDTFTVKQLLHELNEYRRTLGEAPVKEWKASRAKLIERLKATNKAMLDDMDPLAIPAFLRRSSPACFIHKTITPEMQARIDKAMEKSRTAIVASSFAQFDVKAMANADGKARAPQVKKEPRTTPPADTFHLTSLGEGRVLRALARKHTAFLQPLEVQKYVYRNADREKIEAFIKEKTS